MDKYWSLLSLSMAFVILTIEYIIVGENSFSVQNGAIILIAMVQIIILVVRQNFSVGLIHWFFVLLFFGIVPGIKSFYNIFPLVSRSSSPELLLLTTNYAILLWCTVYSLVYNYSTTGRHVLVHFEDDRKKSLSNLYVVAGCLIALAFYVFMQRPLALFVRGGGISGVFSSNIIKLMFQYFCRPAAFFLFALVVLDKRVFNDHNKQVAFAVLTTIIFFLYNSPIATARFYAFAIWISVVSLIFLNKRRTGFALLGILGGGIFGAEVISGFRGGVASALQSEVSFGLEYWTSMTFDAYEMLASAVSYTLTNGYLYGENFLGAMGFFVPRSIWVTKPIGSGAFLMEEFYRFNNPYGDFTNVSCPLVAESFLASGFLGVAVISFVAGGVTKLLDQLYSNSLSLRRPGVKFFQAYYFVAGGTFFFMMRGDLLSSWAYLTGITTSFFIVMKFAEGKIAFPEEATKL